MFDVEESARRIGNYKWAEMKLFEALGGWVATVPELDVKMRLGTHCYKHAWHAELWAARTPTIPPIADPPDVPDDDLQLADATPVADAARRRDYEGSLTGLADELAALRRRVDAALDPSTARTLDLIEFDLIDLRRRLDTNYGVSG